MKQVRDLVKFSNKIFTIIVLTIFYILLVGICWVIFLIVQHIKRQPKSTTYWQVPKNLLNKRDYFSSAF